MRNDSGQKVKMASLEELLGVPTQTVNAPDEERVVKMPLRIIHEFSSHPKGNPFRVCDDKKMAETVESVAKYGVLMPGLVRPHRTIPGEYELVAGHRRRRASELNNLEDMPVLIKNLTDDEAIVLLVDSNIQREDILPSEKAWAYRMKYDALKRMGAQDGIRNDQVLAKESGESRNTIQRYIRLTYLIPELLQLVDDDKLPKNTAAELSYLTEQEQKSVLDVMNSQGIIPSGDQATKLKEFSKEKTLTESLISYVLERKDNIYKVSLPGKKIRGYFPEGYTGQQIEEIIFGLLDEWKARETNKV